MTLARSRHTFSCETPTFPVEPTGQTVIGDGEHSGYTLVHYESPCGQVRITNSLPQYSPNWESWYVELWSNVTGMFMHLSTAFSRKKAIAIARRQCKKSTSHNGGGDQ